MQGCNVVHGFTARHATSLPLASLVPDCLVCDTTGQSGRKMVQRYTITIKLGTLQVNELISRNGSPIEQASRTVTVILNCACKRTDYQLQCQAAGLQKLLPVTFNAANSLIRGKEWK